MRGRVALVTGGGSGLGAAIATRLAADGAVVVVNDLNGEAANKTAADVGGEAVVFDVADAAAFDRAVEDVVERHGRLDILINNAGIASFRDDVLERSMANAMAAMTGGDEVPIGATSGLDDATWDRTIKVHLYGTFHGTRAALRRMEPARHGAIVNIASIAGIQPFPGLPEYAAAKAAIVGFTRSVGFEVAPLGIRVNAIAPGYIDTPALARLPELARQTLPTRIGARRLGHPEEVAALAHFLASDEASYCFGEVLSLTGAAGI